jgi:hypothetical protein
MHPGAKKAIVEDRYFAGTVGNRITVDRDRKHIKNHGKHEKVLDKI